MTGGRGGGSGITVAGVAYLTSDAGRRALTAASARALTDATLVADVAAIRADAGQWAPAVVETVRARRRAAAKLPGTEGWLWTSDAVDQATAGPVAALRAREVARRFPGLPVHDVTCSVGADLAALAAVGLTAIGSDLDPARAAMAAHNLGDVPVLVADALTPTSRGTVVVADPARRAGGRRLWGAAATLPPLPDLLAVYDGRPYAIKCAPGIDHAALRADGFTGETQVVSLDGGVREVCLWSHTDPGVTRRATVLRTERGAEPGAVVVEEITDAEPDDAEPGDPGRFVIDPDGAIVRAGLVRHWATRHGLWQLDPQIAHVTGDAVPPGARGFAIRERLPMTEKVLRRAVRDAGFGSLEILVRGVDVDPDVLRRRLRPEGDVPGALVVTRIGRRATAFLCDAAVRTAHPIDSRRAS